jgi:hypothetical protein
MAYATAGIASPYTANFIFPSLSRFSPLWYRWSGEKQDEYSFRPGKP